MAPRIGMLSDDPVQIFNPVAGTPTGSRVSIPAPVRGWLVEAGFMPNSAVTSAMTLAVAIGSQASSTASNFTNVVSSTVGSFSSTNLYEGAVASVSALVSFPWNSVYVFVGDAIQFTTSGGNSSAIGATIYANIKRG